MITITESFVIQRKSKENMNGWVTERKCMLSLEVEVWEVPSSHQHQSGFSCIPKENWENVGRQKPDSCGYVFVHLGKLP